MTVHLDMYVVVASETKQGDARQGVMLHSEMRGKNRKVAECHLAFSDGTSITSGYHPSSGGRCCPVPPCSKTGINIPDQLETRRRDS